MSMDHLTPLAIAPGQFRNATEFEFGDAILVADENRVWRTEKVGQVVRYAIGAEVFIIGTDQTKLILTLEHGVLLATNTIVPAYTLKVGDLITAADGTPTPVRTCSSTNWGSVLVRLVVLYAPAPGEQQMSGHLLNANGIIICDSFDM